MGIQSIKNIYKSITPISYTKKLLPTFVTMVYLLVYEVGNEEPELHTRQGHKEDQSLDQKSCTNARRDALLVICFPVQQTTSGIGHHVKYLFRVGNQCAECEKQQQLSS